jgi:microsomal dipeptidase-like Zn-dependent dipeptidase
VPLELSAGKVGPDNMKLLKVLGLLPFSVINPSSYTEEGELKNLTVDLFKANYSLKEIKGILGENFIRLFRTAVKN